MSYARSRRWFLFFFSSLALLLVLFMILILFLASGRGGQWLWYQTQKQLLTRGLDLQAEAVDVHLLSSLRFEKLRVKAHNSSSAPRTIDIEELEISYHWTFLPFKIEVQKGVLKNLKGQWTLPDPAPEESPLPPSSRPWMEWIEDPPLQLSIQGWRFEDIDLKLQQSTPTMQWDTHLFLKEWTLSALYRPGEISLKTHYQMPRSNPFSWKKNLNGIEKQLLGEFQLSGNWDLKILAAQKKLKMDRWAFSHTTEFYKIFFQQGVQPPVRVSKMNLQLSAPQIGELRALLSASSDKDPFKNIKTKTLFQWQDSQQTASIEPHVWLDGREVLKGQVQAEVREATRVQADLNFELNQTLLRLWLPSPSDISLHVQTTLDWPQSAPSLLLLPWSSLVQSQFVVQGSVESPLLNFANTKLEKNRFNFKIAQQPSQVWQIQSQFTHRILKSPMTRKAGDLTVRIEADLAQNADQEKLDVHAQWDEAEVLKTKVELRRDDKGLSGDLTYSLKTHPLVEKLKNAALSQMGRYEVQGLAQWKQIIANKDWQDLIQHFQWKEAQIQGTGKVRVKDLPPSIAARLNSEIEYHHRLSLAESQKEGQFTLRIPNLEIPGKIKTDNFVLNAQFQNKNSRTDGDLSVDAERLNVMGGAPSSPENLDLSPFRLHALGALTPAEIGLQKLNLELGRGLASLTAEGRFRPKEQSGLLVSQMHLNFGREGLKWNGLKVTGQLHMPLNIGLEQNKSLFIEGRTLFQDFSVAKGLFELRGVSGALDLHEDLFIKNKKIQFATVSQVNAFTRAAFDRMQPLLEGIDPLRISQVRLEDKVLGPIVLFCSLQQNVLALHRFDVTLNHGSLAGESYINFKPEALSYGLLLRMNRVLLSEVVPRSFLGPHQKEDRPLSLRTAFVYNINRSSMEGRMDITEIGSDQLATMLNILDPDYVNETFNKARSFISYAYPTYVGMAFANGFTDVDLQLNVARLPPVVGVSISPWLADISQKIKNAFQLKAP